MKILYGVQGTGNGHISRANAMAHAFQSHPGLEVTWLLSGRERHKGFGTIEHYLWYEGMTFVVKAGRMQVFDTLRKNNLLRFRRDIRNLDLDGYDLVISDYEPVVAHAARRRGIPVTGIGHQYAFRWPVPTRGENPVVKSIMKSFAPANTAVGLHWHHFGYPILPPILDIPAATALPAIDENKVIVYLPFEEPTDIIALLQAERDFQFHVYHPDLTDADNGHIHTRAISRAFKEDLKSARRVFCNCGFELISECLQLGKTILTKPVHGQMEQLSNARALEELGYAATVDRLSPDALRRWLSQSAPASPLGYPDVAAALAQWIAGGCGDSVQVLADRLWAGMDGERAAA